MQHKTNSWRKGGNLTGLLSYFLYLTYTTNRPTNQQTNQPTDQPTNRPTNQQINQPRDQPTNRPTYQPINQPEAVATLEVPSPWAWGWSACRRQRTRSCPFVRPHSCQPNPCTVTHLPYAIVQNFSTCARKRDSVFFHLLC